MYALGKAHMGSTPSVRSFPNVAFETVPVFLIDDGFLFPRLAPPGGRWCDVLGFVPAGVSQAPQHFRSSETQATCEGSFARQCICSVISPPSDNVQGSTLHPQEFSKVNVDHCHIPVWASHSTFCSKLIESVRMMACVV